MPFGYYSFELRRSKYLYKQGIFGQNGVYTYSGESKNEQAKFSYVFYRDQNLKNDVYLKLWRRSGKNHLQGYELENQRRKSAGYEIGFSSRFFFENGALALKTSFKKQTTALNSPSDKKPQSFDIGADYHAKFGAFSYELNSYLRYGRARDIRDKFTLGSDIRGFDGQANLSANGGYYAKNTLRYHYAPKQNIYAGFDLGVVFGDGSNGLLAGGAAGVSGEISSQTFGKFGYDLWLGFSLHKPQNFTGKSPNINFSINYIF